MTGADMVVTALVEHQVRHVFGYPGGMILPVYDSLRAQSFVRHILVAHEQGAVHAAEGYASSTGKVGCVLVTSGPGATNTVTGLMDAYADSIPLVAITGQVPTKLIGTDAFQECDIRGITQPCTKHNYLVKDVGHLADNLHQAFAIAQRGRSGPVLIDIPLDIQCASGPYRVAVKNVCRPIPDTFHPYTANALAQALDMMRSAERPVFYTGGGTISSDKNASRVLRELVTATGFPITSTLKGLGAYPASGRNWLGMPGMHGAYQANMAMYNADLIIAIGARFDDRVTANVQGFAPNAKKIHIDVDPSSIGKNVRVDLGICADFRRVVDDILKSWPQQNQTKDISPWLRQIAYWRKESISNSTPNGTIQPQSVFQKLGALLAAQEVFIVTDVGQHQMWAAQHLGIEEPRHFITSGGMGTMGFGLPAAIGVQMANREALVVCITGDGSFQMTSHEMVTAKKQALPIKVLVLNNGALGMVRQVQQDSYGERYFESLDIQQPNFVTLAKAYGWRGFSCVSPAQIGRALRKLINSDGPCLLDCTIDRQANCYPKIPSGAAHNTMIMP